MTTHNTAVLFIIHFLHLQAIRLKDTRTLCCFSLNTVKLVEQIWNHVVHYTNTKRLRCAVVLPDIQTSHPGTCGWLALCLVWPCEGTCSDHGASAQQDMISQRFDIKSDTPDCHVITSIQERHRTEQSSVGLPVGKQTRMCFRLLVTMFNKIQGIQICIPHKNI